MRFIFETHGFAPESLLEQIAETTVLYELWAPGRWIETVRLSLSQSDPRRRCFRALLHVEIEGRGNFAAGVIGGEPHEVIERVSVVLGGTLGRIAPAPPMTPARRRPTRSDLPCSAAAA